ncbi:ABC transporter substrate-binding protein [Brevibacillus ginsengisoli]|uniref:ABC transporter substrate-binding protein n=1 Tax=Brevibacillus ginsengisoli TaxID=363854 RepID=UPI003CE71069
MKRKLSGLFSLLLASSFFLSACSEEAANPSQTQPQAEVASMKSNKDEVIPATDKTKIPDAAKNRKDTFVAGISAPEGIFNPYFYNNGWDGNVTSVMFASLIDVDESGKPLPSLAEKWEVSNDQLTYTFHLRKGLTFSDGSPLTAEDVAFTLTILHDKSNDGTVVDISQAHIKGGQAYKEGKATSIEGIKVIDPQTIQITTEQVNARNLLLLGGPVLSKAYYGKGYVQGNLDYLKSLHGKPLGAGPYVFDKFIPGQEVRFHANDKFYAGKPKIEHFIYRITDKDTNFQLFQAGEVDYDGFAANGESLEQLKSLGFADIDVVTAPVYSYIEFNHKKPYFKDKRVRQALIYGLNRKQIIDTFYQGYGEVANVPTPPTSWAFNDEGINKYEYNLDKAKQLLDEAGWKVGADGNREKDGQKLKISYLGRKGKIDDVLIPIAKENYKELGIDLEAEYMDFNAVLAKRKAGDYDLAAFSTPGLVDPAEGVEDFVSTRNEVGYSNPKIDQLYDQTVNTLDLEKRKASFKELFKEANDDPPYILLNYRKSMLAYSARIKGFDPQLGLILSLPHLTIEN